MVNPLYFINEAFRSLWQAKLITFVSTITVGITLFFLTLLTLSLINVEKWVSEKSGGASVTAYLHHTLSPEAEGVALSEIREMKFIDSVNFIPREEAFSNFSSIYGEEILEAVDENPFPASVEVYPEDRDNIDLMVNDLSSVKGVESVVYSQEWFEKLKNFKKKFNYYIYTISGVILFALFFTIANTIKLTVYAREELVVNMQYVGAARWHIRIPFIVEGVLQGVIGALLAFGGVSLIHIFLRDIPLYWADGNLLKVLVIAGATLGWGGSTTAVRRFIK